MRNRSKSLVVAAALAAMPVAAQAVTITFGFNALDVSVATTRNGVYAPLAAGSVVQNGTSITINNVPVGDFLQFGVNGTISNTGAGSATAAAPALGIAAYSFGLTANNPLIAAVSQKGNGNVANGTLVAAPLPHGTSIPVSTVFDFSHPNGLYDGNGGIVPSGGVGGVQTPGNTGFYNYGSGSPGELANGIVIGALGGNGTQAKFTLVPGANNTFAYTQLKSGNAGTSSAGYKNTTFSDTTDSIGAAPTLTINIGTGVVASTHSIISLINGASPASGYGSQDGSIAMTGKGNGSYNVTVAAPFAAATTGSVLVSGFNPGSDKEIYALKLSKGGAGITDTTVLQSIANDINGTGTVPTNASTGVSASLITGVFASLFPAAQGYDLLITSTGANPADAGGNAVLGFDFSSTGGELNPANAGISVTGVAAVPEPATAAGLVLGAAGLLLGRRKRALVAA